MLRLPNGHEFEIACAAGALGWAGDGYPWERPFVFARVIRPNAFTIITKTLTTEPRAGNYRWWAPWRCFRVLGGGNYVNAVGLTNKGLDWWVKTHYPRVEKLADKRKVIVSVMPKDPDDAAVIGNTLGKLPAIVGVELNASCPNVPHDGVAQHLRKTTVALIESCKHPVIVKLGWEQPIEEIVTTLDKDGVAAWDLINAVKWETIFPHKKSPLAKYGYNGAVSGPVIRFYALEALCRIKRVTPRAPFISGGGISIAKDAEHRLKLGGSAVTVGVRFLRNMLSPNQIASQLQRVR